MLQFISSRFRSWLKTSKMARIGGFFAMKAWVSGENVFDELEVGVLRELELALELRVDVLQQQLELQVQALLFDVLRVVEEVREV